MPPHTGFQDLSGWTEGVGSSIGTPLETVVHHTALLHKFHCKFLHGTCRAAPPPPPLLPHLCIVGRVPVGVEQHQPVGANQVEPRATRSRGQQEDASVCQGAGEREARRGDREGRCGIRHSVALLRRKDDLLTSFSGLTLQLRAWEPSALQDTCQPKER